MSRVLTFIALAGILMIGAARAEGAFSVLGVGYRSCDNWTTDQAARKVGALLDRQWVLASFPGSGTLELKAKIR